MVCGNGLRVNKFGEDLPLHCQVFPIEFTMPAAAFNVVFLGIYGFSKRPQ